MKRVIFLSALISSFFTLPLWAADIMEPNCAQVYAWVEPLAPELLSDREARKKEIEPYFTEESIEPVFGISYGVWNSEDKAAAKSVITQCRLEANANGDTDLSKKLIKVILFLSK